MPKKMVIKDINTSRDFIGGDALFSFEFPDTEDGIALRNWWHFVLRNYGKYSCYAMLLMLPSDKEAIQYLVDYSRELDLVSDKDCLVLTVSKNDFGNKYLEGGVRALAVNEYVSEGYSLRIARLFNINLELFPCLIIFKDIRTSEHITVSFKGLSVDEIALKIRMVFSSIRNAAIEKQNPIVALEKERKRAQYQVAGKSIISQIQVFAGKTFEVAMEALVKTQIK